MQSLSQPIFDTSALVVGFRRRVVVVEPVWVGRVTQPFQLCVSRSPIAYCDGTHAFGALRALADGTPRIEIKSNTGNSSILSARKKMKYPPYLSSNDALTYTPYTWSTARWVQHTDCRLPILWMDVLPSEACYGGFCAVL